VSARRPYPRRAAGPEPVDAPGGCQHTFAIDTTSTGLSEGKHSVEARVQDGAAHWSATSAPFSFVIDRTAPSITRADGPLRQFAVGEGVHDLTIEAADASVLGQSSGVARIEVFVTPPGGSEKLAPNR